MVENHDSWAVNIKQELQSLGLDQMWDELILVVKSAYKIIEERINDSEKQTRINLICILISCMLTEINTQKKKKNKKTSKL